MKLLRILNGLVVRIMARCAKELALLAGLVFFGFSAIALAQSPVDGFDPNANGLVNALAVQSDGKILVGGSFSTIGGQTRNRIARLNPDGTVDTTFNPNADNAVSTIAIQPDGKILVGGNFSTIGGQTRGSFARLNSNGTLDMSFNPNVNGIIFTTIPQRDGKILIGGNFTSVSGQTRNYIARLNADGSLDTSFNPNANNFVNAFAIQLDGKILVGGSFTQIGGQTSSRIVRLNLDGTLDVGFNSNINLSVQALVLQPDGKVLAAVTGSTIRLNTNGSIDTTFLNPAINGNPLALALQSDGKVLVGGGFVEVNGQPRNNIARLYPNGSLDASLLTWLELTSGNPFIKVLAIQTDGKVLLGGGFTEVNGQPRNNIARLNPDGTLDTSFDPSIGLTSVRAILLQPDGKIVVGGAGGVIRLNANGTVDTSFTNPNPDNTVLSLALQHDGKILVGGNFDRIGGQVRRRIARLNSDGSLDTTFPDLGAGSVLVSTVSAFVIALQSDGKILIGGDFSFVYTDSPRLRGLARLNSDGTVDTSFIPDSNITGNPLMAVVVQPDGKILVGTTSGIARLNSNGTLDTTFTNFSSQDVHTIALQSDGKILIGGRFNRVSNQTRLCTARLNTDGSLDTTFNASVGPSCSEVLAIALQPDGKILVGGTNVATVPGGGAFYDLVRLTNDMAAFNAFSSTTSSVTLTRKGTAPLFDHVTFELSTNGGASYSTLGTVFPSTMSDGVRYSLSGLNLPINQNILIRARGFYGQGIGLPQSIEERVQLVYLLPTLFDFDGDGRADISVFRADANPSNADFYVLRSTSGSFTGFSWGAPGDKLAPADYDGDGKTDIAVWRENVSGNQAFFYILNSSTNTFRIERFGLTGDKLVVGDWDGDGLADPAVYRDSAVGSQSFFYYLGSLNNPSRGETFLRFGLSGDRPVRGDFDGDGKLDLAVFRSGQWIIRYSSTDQVVYVTFGLSTDTLVPADYDGDGKTDIAVFRNGVWYILHSSLQQVRIQQFGLSTDIPVPADYEGSGKANIAVFRGGIWYILSASGSSMTQVNFGLSDDIPVESAYIGLPN